ncbi:transporter substrate-binding domain-containing protein [Massilia sp. W12]|uniref:substrate-binding periplasmic protein n=1 Tax=Massilia sp. W12 TaxID=3126507 RepID=UPI0030D17E53
MSLNRRQALAATLLCLSAPRLLRSENAPIRLAFSDVPSWPWQVGESMALANPPGIAVELIKLAAAQTGMLLQIERMPNKRILQSLQSGALDGAFIYSYSAERAQFAAYPMQKGQPDSSRRVARLSYYLYQLQGRPAIWDGQQFTRLHAPLGANAGYSIAEDLRKQGMEVEEAKTTEQNFAKLRKGRLAALAHQDHIADLYLAQHKIKDVQRLPQALSSKDYFLIFNRQFAQTQAAQVETLWERIGTLRDNFTRQALPRYSAKE